MNISGVLVSVRPEKMDQVKAAYAKLDGVEIHAETDNSQLIVTVEEVNGADSMLAIHRTEGVIAASLVYHNFEQNETEKSDISEQEGLVA